MAVITECTTRSRHVMLWGRRKKKHPVEWCSFVHASHICLYSLRLPGQTKRNVPSDDLMAVEGSKILLFWTFFAVLSTRLGRGFKLCRPPWMKRREKLTQRQKEEKSRCVSARWRTAATAALFLKAIRHLASNKKGVHFLLPLFFCLAACCYVRMDVKKSSLPPILDISLAVIAGRRRLGRRRRRPMHWTSPTLSLSLFLTILEGVEVRQPTTPTTPTTSFILLLFVCWPTNFEGRDTRITVMTVVLYGQQPLLTP